MRIDLQALEAAQGCCGLAHGEISGWGHILGRGTQVLSWATKKCERPGEERVLRGSEDGGCPAGLQAMAAWVVGAGGWICWCAGLSARDLQCWSMPWRCWAAERLP